MRIRRSSGTGPWALAIAMAVAVPGALVTSTPASAGTTVAAASGEPTRTTVSASHRSRSRTRVYVRPHLSTSWYVGWGPYWGPYWGPSWGGYGYGPGLGYTRVYPRPGAVHGALDTDLSPERAEVWVDGQKVGVADNFDGFPDYLWLERGTYDVVFYMPGYKTIARQYSIYPGLVIDVGDRMERGESVHPLDLGPASHERRDARLERDRELRERAEAGERAWDLESAGRAAGEEYLDARAEPGRLRLRVEPTDASVYLDGRFLGTGDDLERLRAGLLVDSGPHRLEVVRPGYRSEERTVEVDAGEETVIAVALTVGDR